MRKIFTTTWRWLNVRRRYGFFGFVVCLYGLPGLIDDGGTWMKWLRSLFDGANWQWRNLLVISLGVLSLGWALAPERSVSWARDQVTRQRRRLNPWQTTTVPRVNLVAILEHPPALMPKEGIAVVMVATKSGDKYEATFTLDVWRRWIDRLQEGDAVRLTGYPVESRRDHAGNSPPRLLDCRLEKVKLS